MKTGPAVAVTSDTAALLATELLARTRDVRRARGVPRAVPRRFSAASHNAVQDVGARIEAEHVVVEFDVRGCGGAVES
jgi:hypothetical protein